MDRVSRFGSGEPQRDGDHTLNWSVWHSQSSQMAICGLWTATDHPQALAVLLTGSEQPQTNPTIGQLPFQFWRADLRANNRQSINPQNPPGNSCLYVELAIYIVRLYKGLPAWYNMIICVFLGGFQRI